jgi:CDP-4-dehydro-6-deoxyglucose reductase
LYFGAEIEYCLAYNSAEQRPQQQSLMNHTIRNITNNTSFIAEKDETILQAALRNNHLYPYGCQSGACGACKARLVSGKVEHLRRDPGVLSDNELDQGICLPCQAVPLSDIEIEVKEIARAKHIEIKTLPTRVREKTLLCDDVVQLYLSLPSTQIFEFRPGQYINILLKNGKERSFSIANTPAQAKQQGLELHIRIVADGYYSPQVKESVQPKDILRIQGPFGTYFLRKDEELPIIMVAGGTGYAPIKGLIEDAIESKSSLPITLYWGARTKADLYLNEQAEHWADNIEGFKYIPVLSEATEADNWAGRTGFVHDAIAQDFPDASGHSVYASGPPVMVDALKEVFDSNGLDAEFFYSDAFDYAAENE